jgi:hypothetical protein
MGIGFSFRVAVTALVLIEGIAEEVVGGFERGDGHADLAGCVGFAVEQDVRAFENQGGVALLVEAEFPEGSSFAEEVGPEIKIAYQDLDVFGSGQVGQGGGHRRILQKAVKGLSALFYVQ